MRRITRSHFGRARRSNLAVHRAWLAAVEALERRALLSVSFSGPVTWGAGDVTSAVAAGDFNEDGKQDLAAANAGAAAESVSILLGNGSGGFTAPNDFPAGDTPVGVTVADFNEDDHQDLAVANFNDNDLSVLLGDGNGNFSAPVSFAVLDNPSSIAVGDFNEDGHLDMAANNLDIDKVSVLLGDGTGGFAPQVGFSAPSPTCVVVGDFDGDNHLDLAAGSLNAAAVTILLGDGAGNFGISSTPLNHFADTVSSLAVADFNGDNKQDLVGAESLNDPFAHVLIGDGNGGFDHTLTLQIASFFAKPNSIVAGDFNNDGNADFATANHGDDDFVSVVLGDGSGSFSVVGGLPGTIPTGQNSFSVAVGDFNGDGKQDLATANRDGDSVGVMLNTSIAPPPKFTGPVNYASGDFPLSVAVGDVNGDGKDDLAVANLLDDSVSILLNNGLGGFSAPNIILVPDGPRSVVISEFDGDGKADLAVVSGSARTLRTLRGNGLGGFSTVSTFTFPVGSQLGEVAIGDFREDGHLDFAVTDHGNHIVRVLPGVGGGGFLVTDLVDIPVGGFPTGIAMGYFNNDDHLDLVTANTGVDTASILLGDGGGNFGVTDFATSIGPDSVAVGDLNGDGNLDVVTGNIGIDDISVLLSNGSGGFAASRTFSGGGTFLESVAIADFNGDGLLDVAAVCSGNAGAGMGVRVLLGDGDGNLEPPVSFAAGNEPRCIAVGDFNDDGRPDLATANSASDNASILLNALPPVPKPRFEDTTITPSINEGGVAMLEGEISGPDPFDLTIDWGDGSTPEVHALNPGVFSFTHLYEDDNPSGTPQDDYTVQLTASNSLGSSSEGVTATVKNVAPTPGAIAGPATSVRGVPVTFTSPGVTDPGVLDTIEVAWDFGDGSFTPFTPVAAGTPLSISHIYSTSGPFIVSLVARDDDNGGVTTVTTTFNVNIAPAGLVADPSEPSKKLLLVGGTAAGDIIRVNPSGKQVDVFINAAFVGRFAEASKVIVWGLGGADDIRTDPKLSIPAILIGDDGGDVLVSSGERDFLIGGTGLDNLTANGSEDILIGGATAHDHNLQALALISREWIKGGDYKKRILHLTTGGGINGSFLLNGSSIASDVEVDTMTGGGSKDWFIFSLNDVLTDLAKDEAATFI